MELIRKVNSSGYPWSTTEEFYMCDSLEEYEQLKASHKKEVGFRKWCFHDTDVKFNADTIASDVFAVYCGKTIAGVCLQIGESVSYPSGIVYTTVKNYIKPDCFDVIDVLLL